MLPNHDGVSLSQIIQFFLRYFSRFKRVAQNILEVRHKGLASTKQQPVSAKRAIVAPPERGARVTCEDPANLALVFRALQSAQVTGMSGGITANLGDVLPHFGLTLVEPRDVATHPADVATDLGKLPLNVSLEPG